MTPTELREWRGERTQLQAAVALSMSPHTYQAYEQGRRKIKPQLELIILGSEARKNKRKRAEPKSAFKMIGLRLR